MTDRYKLNFSVTVTVDSVDDATEYRVLHHLRSYFGSHVDKFRTEPIDGEDIPFNVLRVDVDNSSFSKTITRGHGNCVYPMQALSFDGAINRWNNSWRLIRSNSDNWDKVQNIRPLLAPHDPYGDSYTLPEIDRKRFLKIWPLFVNRVNQKIDYLKRDEMQLIIAEHWEGEYEDGLMDDPETKNIESTPDYPINSDHSYYDPDLI